MHSKRGEPSLHGWPDKQILGNISANFQHFCFDQKSEKTLQAFQKKELYFFLLIRVLLMLSYLLKPLLMMIDDRVILVCVYMLLLRESFW